MTKVIIGKPEKVTAKQIPRVMILNESADATADLFLYFKVCFICDCFISESINTYINTK